MSGLYNYRNWRYFGTRGPIAKTIGHYIQEAGYSTCIVGKWQKLKQYEVGKAPIWVESLSLP